jgi:hypothetical protein
MVACINPLFWLIVTVVQQVLCKETPFWMAAVLSKNRLEIEVRGEIG